MKDDDALYRQQKTGFDPPKDLGRALSLIQTWYMIESRGEPLHPDYFRWDHWTSFTWVGTHSAWQDSVIWVIGYVLCGALAFFLQENYAINFLTTKPTQVLFWTVGVSPLYGVVKLASFGYWATHTGMCLMMARRYTGNVCKSANNAIFASRTSFLLAFSVIIFVAMALVRQVLSDNNMLRIGLFIGNFSELHAVRVYIFLKYFFKQYCFEASMVCLTGSVLATALHFGTMVIYRVKNKRNRPLSPGTAK